MANILDNTGILPKSVEGETIMDGLWKGALLGGGAASLVALIREVRKMKEEAKRNNPNYQDDGTLFMNIADPDTPAKDEPVDKKASRRNYERDNMLNAAGWMLGAGTGAVGSYMLVDYLIREYKKKQVQKELDEAQVQMLRLQTGYDPVAEARKKLEQGTEEGKQASRSSPEFGAMSLAGGGALSLFALLSLASAVATNKLLDENNPMPKLKSNLPNKVVVRKVGIGLSEKEKLDLAEEHARSVENIPGGGMEKEVPLEQVPPAAVEAVAHSVLNNDVKAASTADIRDLLTVIASGGRNFVLDKITEGSDVLMEAVKGASEVSIPYAKMDLAIKWACAHPRVAPLFGLLVASEAFDQNPNLVKQAACLPSSMQDSLLRICGLTACALTEVKSAAVGKQMQMLMPKLIAADAIGNMIDAPTGASGKALLVSEDALRREQLKNELASIDIDTLDPELRMLIKETLKEQAEEELDDEQDGVEDK